MDECAICGQPALEVGGLCVEHSREDGTIEVEPHKVKILPTEAPDMPDDLDYEVDEPDAPHSQHNFDPTPRDKHGDPLPTVISPTPHSESLDWIDILWKRTNRHGRYYDKPIKLGEFREAISAHSLQERIEELRLTRKWFVDDCWEARKLDERIAELEGNNAATVS